MPYKDYQKQINNAKNWAKQNYQKKLVQARNRWGRNLKTYYGITAKDYYKMLADQFWGCAICGRSTPGKRLAVDHDHQTGKVRGILCYRCNMIVGLYETTKRSQIENYLNRSIK